MKVLIAPDSFKGTLTAQQICQILEEELAQDFEIIKHPLADGGEGTLEALKNCCAASRWISCEVLSPLPQNHVIAQYLWLEDTQEAFIEMAQASGLTLLENGQKNPELTTTYGTGQLLQNAIERGAKKIYLAIGGSATNDGGIGALMALGWQFLDINGQSIPLGGKEMIRIHQITPPPNPSLPPTEVLCDVTNPLYGEKGAAYVYAPQKGADVACVKRLDRGLRHFAHQVNQQLGISLNFPGAGAAGGMGAGAKLGLNAEIRSGFEVIRKITHLDSQIKAADIVITGEGKFDHQSLQGKVVSGVLELTQNYHKPLILLAGVSEFEVYPNIQQIVTLVGSDVSPECAMEQAEEILRKRCQKLTNHLKVLLF